MARKGNQHKNKAPASPVDASPTENVQQMDPKSFDPTTQNLTKNPKKNKTMQNSKTKRETMSSKPGNRDDSLNSTQGNSIPSSHLTKSSFINNIMNGSRFAETTVGRYLGAFALHILKLVNQWVERQKPQINSLTTFIYNSRDYVYFKIKLVYPIIRAWLFQLGSIVILLSVLWLDCCLRGLNSLLHLGTTSFFAIIWGSFLSILAMIGVTKMLLLMVATGVIAVFIGLAIAAIALALVATIILWVHGSFWTTGLVIVAGGVAFAFKCERVALFITSLYTAYCARCYVGWFGLLVGLNLSFVSSDALIYILKNRLNDQRFNTHSEQFPQSENVSGNLYGESMHSSQAEDGFQSTFRRSVDHSSGMPSTSGAGTEMTSESEVARLLNCYDHYSVLGFARFENIDASILKREYRKKAMLVHPDKNMGNEKAAEAFKKLQNAYEVLLDSLKRKTYDDDLRKEELLNYFRRFQSLSHKSRKYGGFGPGFHQNEHEDIDTYGEPRRITCKKCNNFHIWICTNRSKSQARWCQECNEFHQAKDGDGWLEQSFQPVMFGLLQKMDPPHAYVCAESRIYDTTEWFICQGMKCPANTHKPSFHVNTSLASKCNAKGASSSNGANGGMPMPNMDSPMTEEEFFEWLQNTVQSGSFDTNNTSDESQGKPTNISKNNVKKRRKGKKQW